MQATQRDPVAGRANRQGAAADQVHEARISGLRERMEAEGLDALIVTSLPNIFYLTAFTGTTAQLLVTSGSLQFITDFRYHQRFEEEVRGGWELVDSALGDLLSTLIPNLCKDLGVIRVGFESAHMSYSAHCKLEAGWPDAVPTLMMVEELRMVKDADEILAMQKAVRITEAILQEVLALIGPGIRECEIAAEIEYRARLKGASACSFTPIIASGARAALPHAGFTDAQVVPDAPLTIDLGVVFQGYCSDMTRTVFVGGCSQRWRKIYELVRAAKSAGFDTLRPGVACAEADRAAREVIEEAGFGDNYRHGLGHGVGIQIHEDPRLIWSSSRALASGNVVTCEPGIYLPGEGGVRIEDLVVVTDEGARNLMAMGTELLVL